MRWNLRPGSAKSRWSSRRLPRRRAPTNAKPCCLSSAASLRRPRRSMVVRAPRWAARRGAGGSRKRSYGPGEYCFASRQIELTVGAHERGRPADSRTDFAARPRAATPAGRRLGRRLWGGCRRGLSRHGPICRATGPALATRISSAKSIAGRGTTAAETGRRRWLLGLDSAARFPVGGLAPPA